MTLADGRIIDTRAFYVQGAPTYSKQITKSTEHSRIEKLILLRVIYLLLARQPLVGHGLLIYEVF